MLIPIDKIKPNPQQPRQVIDETELASLAESIRLHGLINPISVEEEGDSYILIDGERRWRACKLAGQTEIEASIRPGLNGSGQTERLILATVANLQRADMSALDKANAFQELLAQGLTHAEIARSTGKSTATVANYLLILSLPASVRKLHGRGMLSGDARVTRALQRLGDETLMLAVARSALKNRLDANQTINLARRIMKGKAISKKRAEMKSRAELSPAWEGKWNMIAVIGNPAMDGHLRTAAMYTCKSCALWEEASPKVCKDCPAADLLRRLVKP